MKLFTSSNPFKYSLYILSSILLHGEPVMAQIKKASTANSLKTYRTKRDLTKSPEPKGTISSKKTGNIFVIHKHQASHLHYDLRLAFDGVLLSWAVPKGPSLNPSEKRLAMHVEDHPMDYKDFEGVIPEGYGAGTVMVWDHGTYTNIKQKNGKLVPFKQCLEDGTIEVFFDGEKIKGDYALVRMGDAQSKKWLLIKMHDEYASARKNPTSTQNKSVKTGRTMTQIANKQKPRPTTASLQKSGAKSGRKKKV
jgi:DNA ligase D-like protein (predicted 3'-phosphoesterase)